MLFLLLVLTQLEGMTLDLYKGTVMPRVLEQVINCKDDIAQPYLLDALIQVFPDEFHVQTLDAFLEACPLLKPTVKIGNVLASLMERLASSAQDNPEIVAQFVAVDAFGKLRAGCKSIIASQPSMDAHDRLQMHAALMGFVTAVHRDRLDYVDDVLGACADALNAPGGNDEKDSKENSSDERGDRGGIEGGSEDAGPPMIVSDQKGVRQLHALLTVPLDTLARVLPQVPPRATQAVVRFFGVPMCLLGPFWAQSNDLHWDPRVTVEWQSAPGKVAFTGIYSWAPDRRRQHAAACDACVRKPMCMGVYDAVATDHDVGALTPFTD